MNDTQNSPEIIRTPALWYYPAGVLLPPKSCLVQVRKHGMFEIPGGKKKRGEKTLDAARRELEQETGLKATSLRYLAQREYPSTTRKNDMVKWKIYIHSIISTARPNTIINRPDEIISIRWLLYEEIMDGEVQVEPKTRRWCEEFQSLLQQPVPYLAAP